MSRILVAYDGSEVSRRALDRVIAFTKDAEVALVTVARPIYRDPPFTGYADPSEEDQQNKLLVDAHDALEKGGITSTGYAPVGDPAEKILEAANAFGADLIVLGARSLGTVERFALGSVSTKVMHDADCDILIVK